MRLRSTMEGKPRIQTKRLGSSRSQNGPKTGMPIASCGWMNSLSKSEMRVSRAPACNVYCLNSTTEQLCNNAVLFTKFCPRDAAKPASMPASFKISRRVLIRSQASVQITDCNAKVQFLDIRKDHFQRLDGRSVCRQASVNTEAEQGLCCCAAQLHPTNSWREH